ncbi:MAG: hypothetical protein J0M36_06560 [Caulobacterales bacterium]|nr:hypothetical protein [Caulobacterales bacterium]
MADESYRTPGGAPAPDPSRVVELAAALTPSPEFAAAEDARANEALTRLAEAAKARGVDCADLLNDIRARLSRLSPQGLVPRRGLAGLFDGRGKRLKVFRTAFNDGCTALSSALAGLGEHAESGARRTVDLDSLAHELRDIVSALTEQVAAARERLARETGDDEAIAAFRARVEGLETRLAATVRALPLIRALQNADARTREALTGAPKAVEAWQADWKTHLGLDGKRPRKVRPAPEALAPAHDKVAAALTRIETEQAAAAQRRQEILSRLG